MSPERDPRRRWFADPWARLAVGAWVVVLAVVCTRAALAPRRNSVTPIFAKAARAWLAGDDLYFILIEQKTDGLDHYRYSPGVAPLLAPFAFVSDAAGGVLWRLLNAAAFLGAAAWWLRDVLPERPTARQAALFFLLVLPPAVGSLNNGQSNPLVVGLMLAAAAACARARWNLATLCVALAALLKVYPLAVGLLLLVVYPRRLAWRLPLGVALAALLPFLAQRPDYVLAQYRDWVGVLTTDDRAWWPPEYAYRDAWMLWRLSGLPASRGAYVAVQLLAAALVAAACFAARHRGESPRRVLAALTALGTGWLTLFGPATESCTYVLLAPALAWTLISARAASPRGFAAALAAYALLTVCSVALWFPGGRAAQALGLQPLAALLVFGWHLLSHAPAARPGSAPAGALGR